MAELSALLDAARKNDVAAIQAILAENPELAGAKTEEGDSAILQAAYYGAKDSVEALRHACKSISPFEAAAIGDLMTVMRAIGRDPAVIAAYSHDGWTLLHLAAFFGHKELVDYLLGFQPDLASPSRNPMHVNPLQSALANGHEEIAQTLIEAGAPLGAPEGGWTPLHYAASNNLLTTADLLLQRGADPRTPNKDGKSPLDLANEYGNALMISILETAAKSQ